MKMKELIKQEIFEWMHTFACHHIDEFYENYKSGNHKMTINFYVGEVSYIVNQSGLTREDGKEIDDRELLGVYSHCVACAQWANDQDYKILFNINTLLQ